MVVMVAVAAAAEADDDDADNGDEAGESIDTPVRPAAAADGDIRPAGPEPAIGEGALLPPSRRVRDAALALRPPAPPPHDHSPNPVVAVPPLLPPPPPLPAMLMGEPPDPPCAAAAAAAAVADAEVVEGGGNGGRLDAPEMPPPSAWAGDRDVANPAMPAAAGGDATGDCSVAGAAAAPVGAAEVVTSTLLVICVAPKWYVQELGSDSDDNRCTAAGVTMPTAPPLCTAADRLEVRDISSCMACSGACGGDAVADAAAAAAPEALLLWASGCSGGTRGTGEAAAAPAGSVRCVPWEGSKLEG